MLLIHVVRHINYLDHIITLLVYLIVKLLQQTDEVAARGRPFCSEVKDYDPFSIQVVLLRDCLSTQPQIVTDQVSHLHQPGLH